VGGGLEIAALCDLRICGASSRFGAPIKNLGLVMAYAEMAPLVRLVGPAAARIAEGAPLVARWHKKFARRLADPTPISEVEADECFDCFDTEDFRIGYAAFLAKQKPAFKGR